MMTRKNGQASRLPAVYSRLPTADCWLIFRQGGVHIVGPGEDATGEILQFAEARVLEPRTVLPS